MRWLAVVFMLLTVPALAAIRLADADPAPGDESYIFDNRITLTFGEAVKPLSIKVVDALGREVQTGAVEGTDHDIEVLMKAPDRSGYICGTMSVAWHVKSIESGTEQRGVYNFWVMSHGGKTCVHQ